MATKYERKVKRGRIIFWIAILFPVLLVLGYFLSIFTIIQGFAASFK